MLLQESTSSEYRRVFGEIAQDRPDAIIVSDISELVPYRQLIVELVEKSRLPAIYPFRHCVEAGGLMACGTDLVELWRRMADDVHQILNGANPGDIPIYQPTKFEFLINLKAAKALGLTLPPTLLAARRRGHRMRRRDFTIGLLLATTVGTVRRNSGRSSTGSP